MDIKVIILAETGPGGALVQLPEPSRVEIKEQLRQPITFTLTYGVDICDGHFELIKGNYFDPFREIEVWLSIDGKKFCLVKGLVQSQQIKLIHGGQGSQLTVSGADNSIRMGWVTEIKNWKKKIDAEDIIQMLTSVQKTKKGHAAVRNFAFNKYIIMGVEYGVSIQSKQLDKDEDLEKAVTINKHDPKEQSPHFSFKDEQVQKADDLSFIRQLAEQKGMYFWISYDKQGEEIAHFDKLPLGKPTNPDGSNIQTIAINHAENALDEFSISWDSDRPTSVTSEYVDKRSKEIIPATVPIAKQPKLGNITLASMTGHLISTFHWSMVSNVAEQAERDEAALNEAEWFIKASCSTSFDRICKSFDATNPTTLFHAHDLVHIGGAGSKHSGLYIISGVTHSIDAGAYKIQLELMRNAWNGIEKDSSPAITHPAEEIVFIEE